MSTVTSYYMAYTVPHSSVMNATATLARCAAKKETATMAHMASLNLSMLS